MKSERVGASNRNPWAHHPGIRTFLTGLPGRLLGARLSAADDETRVSSVLATLSAIVREGCDSPESLAVRLHLTRSVSRVAARKHYDAVRQHIQLGNPNESFEETLERIRRADVIASFDNLSNFDGDS
jgi:hypothetical protein